MRGGGAVTRFVGEGRGNRLLAVSQRAHVCRRNAHAPASGRVQHRGVVFAVQGDGNDVTRLRARDLARDDQRLAVLGNIHDVVARDDVETDLRHGGIHQHGGIRAGRVAGFVGHGSRDRGVTVGNARQIGCRHVQRPAAVGLHLRGVLVAVEGYGDRLACFGSGRPAQGQILRCLSRVQHVIAADGIDGHRWRGGIDAELLRRRRRVTVHVAHADLHAGVAVLQAAQIGCRYGVRPVAVGVHRRGVGFTRKGDGDGLARFYVCGGAGKHQILTFFCRVEHVVRGHAVDADGDRREIDVHDGADSHRVAGRVLRACLDIQRTVRPLGHVRCRNRRLPCTVRQYGCGIDLTVNGHRDGAARCQIGA